MNRGFTLIVAILVSSVVLTIGLSVFNLGLKQLVLSSTDRESLYSLAAADAGIECALLWDGDVSAPFGTSTPKPANISCGGQGVSVVAASVATSTFLYKLEGTDMGSCAYVEVGKSLTPLGNVKTFVKSNGYNTCDTGDTRRTERGLFLSV